MPDNMKDFTIHTVISLVFALSAIAMMPEVINNPFMSNDEKLLFIGLLYGFCLGLLGSMFSKLLWDSIKAVSIILSKKGR